MVTDLNPNAGSNPSNLTDVNGTLFFDAQAGSVCCALYKTDGTMVLIENPSLMPHASTVSHVEEPFVKARIVTPADYIGPIMSLGNEREVQPSAPLGADGAAGPVGRDLEGGAVRTQLRRPVADQLVQRLAPEVAPLLQSEVRVLERQLRQR